MPPPDYFEMMRGLNSIATVIDKINQRARYEGLDTIQYAQVLSALHSSIIDITNAVMLPRKVEIPANLR